MRFPAALLLALAACDPKPSTGDSDDTDAGGTDSGGTTDSGGGTDTGGATDTGGGTDSGDTGSTTDTGDTGDTGSTASFAPTAYRTEIASGTRLTAQGVVSDEGNEMLAWFDDTLLGTRCTIQRAGDGVLRCLPESTDLPAGLNGSFADNACTVPVTLIPTSCQSTETLRNNGRIYEIAGFAPNTFTQGVGGCSSSAIPGGRTAVTLDEVPLTDFVAFTEVPVTVADGVGFVRYDGADGSKALGGLWHVGEAQPGLLVEGTRVVPYAHSRITNDLVSPTCAGGASDGAYIAGEVTPTPAYAEIISFAPPCPRCPPAPTAPVYREITGTQDTWCDFGIERTVGDGQTVYLLGPNTTPLADFPEVSVQADTRAGVRFNHLVTSGGTPVGPHPLGGLGVVRIDGDVANAQVLFDGGLAGAPDQYLTGPLFTNSTCATPVVDAGSSAMAGDTVLLFASEQGVVCETLPLPIQEVKAVYTVSTAPAQWRSVWLWNGESCLSAGETSILSLTEVAAPLTVLTDIALSAR